ncbi:MAG: acyl-CoA dehydrogenase family protein [Rhodobacteraceae bacterium]|nr:acyl-CoA dehydrogenase family protein [Paracoccaceae bacterium]
MARTLPPLGDLPTHSVTNQPPEPGDRDLWADDAALRAAAAGAGADLAALARHGPVLGTAALREAGREANRVPPVLRGFDRAGRRLDEVTFHPAYHEFLRLGLAAGYAACAWEGGAGGHATHAALVYLHSQVEPGTCCPMTMTHAAVPLLAGLPDWRARALSRRYDPAVAPMELKAGVTLGMAMTEKQGGSDLRATATRAEADGGGWRLTGHKWFCSAPMSDGFLTLALAPDGIGCFLVPRWLPDGRNAIRLMRLKDKLGNRANASAEIEYERAYALRLGEAGRGIATIIAMVHETRLDTAIAPAGLMRAALSEAHRWVLHRTAFQRRLIDQPLMRAVLADLCLDWEAATALGFRVARAFDGDGPEDRAFARIAVALAKFLANRRCVSVVAEAMEVLGGMGYVEDTDLPLLYREAPLNGIWEGSGNVICLDALRTLSREPAAAAALEGELDAARGADRRFDAALADFRARWPGPVPEAEARAFVERAALLLSAAVLLRTAPAPVAEGYVGARLPPQGLTPGTAGGLDTAAILARLSPDG